MKRSKPLQARSLLKRFAPLRKRNPERAKRLHEEQFGGAEWLRELCCAICWKHPPSVIHHVTSRGAGGKAVGNTLPCCPKHHLLIHTMGRKSFEAKYRVDLQSLCDALWEPVP